MKHLFKTKKVFYFLGIILIPLFIFVGCDNSIFDKAIKYSHIAEPNEITSITGEKSDIKTIGFVLNKMYIVDEMKSLLLAHKIKVWRIDFGYKGIGGGFGAATAETVSFAFENVETAIKGWINPDDLSKTSSTLSVAEQETIKVMRGEVGAIYGIILEGSVEELQAISSKLDIEIMYEFVGGKYRMTLPYSQTYSKIVEESVKKGYYGKESVISDKEKETIEIQNELNMENSKENSLYKMENMLLSYDYTYYPKKGGAMYLSPSSENKKQDQIKFTMQWLEEKVNNPSTAFFDKMAWAGFELDFVPKTNMYSSCSATSDLPYWYNDCETAGVFEVNNAFGFGSFKAHDIEKSTTKKERAYTGKINLNRSSSYKSNTAFDFSITAQRNVPIVNSSNLYGADLTCVRGVNVIKSCYSASNRNQAIWCRCSTKSTVLYRSDYASERLKTSNVGLFVWNYPLEK